MSIYYILFYISTFVWFLPLYKQKDTEYFWYFVALALSDPLGKLLITLFHFPATYYILFALSIKLSFLQSEKARKLTLGISMASAALFLFVFNSRENIYAGAIVFICIILYTIILKKHKYLIKNRVNVFLSLLVFYNMINLLKYLALVLSFHQGAVSFLMGYAFQILLGILFTFININTKNFKLNLTFFEKRAE